MMDMEFMDLYRRSYSALNMQPFNGQPHAPPQAPQRHYPTWSPQLLAFYQQYPQRPAAVIMNHAGMHSPKQTEPKPRLAKDEVELLEREFVKNPKPNSSTKRELAEQMGVEVPRINNWFQNRRAKEKQMRKAREFEAGQARERAASDSKSSDGTEDDGIMTEAESTDDLRSISISRAVFGDEDGDLDLAEDGRAGMRDIECDDARENDDDDDDSSPSQGCGDSPDSFVRIDYQSAALPVRHNHELVVIDDASSRTIPVMFPSNHLHQADYRPQSSYHYVLSEQSVLSDEVQVPVPGFDSHSSQAGFVSDESMFGSFPDASYYATAHIHPFHGQMIHQSTALPHDPHGRRQQQYLAEDERIKEEEGGEEEEEQEEQEELSPLSSSASPPAATDTRFKSPPPPADIASRRNMRRPAPLGLASLRSASHHCHGAKTGCVEGPRRSDAPSPMRRIASATGMSGRIQKSLGGGPRSPFPLDRNREALLHNLHHQTTRSPVMASLDSALSPLTPEGIAAQGLRETTVSTSASDEEQVYAFGSMGVTLFQAEHTIKTPPGTPGLPLSFHDANIASTTNTTTTTMFASGIDHAWHYAPHDESLPTPSLCSHGSELEYPMAAQLPTYVASQPTTPSFPPGIGPTYNGFFGKTSLMSAEYTFPDSYAVEDSARSSPGQPKTRQFQFAQNITPQDFNNKEK